jgi:hypothetical protein
MKKKFLTVVIGLGLAVALGACGEPAPETPSAPTTPAPAPGAPAPTTPAPATPATPATP